MPATAQFQHRLHGFSGCTVEVWRVGDHSVVHKTAARPELNGKLELEFQKLQRLADIASESALFYVPALHCPGRHPDGRAYYEIDFVPGWGLDAYLPRATPAQIQEAAGRIFEIIRCFRALPAGGDASGQPLPEGEFLRAKFRETSDALAGLGEQFPAARPLIEQYNCLSAAIKYPGETAGQGSFCHGDLALDNVLVDRHGRLALIDPLINGHESFMWDVAKVFQSSLLRWRPLKNGEFELDLPRGKIYLKDSERTAWFNLCYARLVLAQFDPAAITLYLAATLARAAKYAHTAKQLCALLLLTNDLITRCLERRYDLDEPPGPLCR